MKKITGYWLLLGFGMIFGWWVTDEHYQKQIAQERASSQKQMTLIVEKNRLIEQTRQAQMNELDQKYFDKKEEFKNEMDRLKSDIHSSNQRLSVAVKNCRPSTQTGQSASMDNAETRAELSEESLRFFDTEAVRADEITLQLNACIDVIETDRKNNVIESLF